MVENHSGPGRPAQDGRDGEPVVNDRRRIEPETGKPAPAGAPKAMFETFRAQYAPKTRAANRRVAATDPAIGERPADDAATKEAEGTTKRLF